MQAANKKIELINTEMALLMAKYKDAYRKSRNAIGFEKELYQREMDQCTRRLLELRLWKGNIEARFFTDVANAMRFSRSMEK